MERFREISIGSQRKRQKDKKKFQIFFGQNEMKQYHNEILCRETICTVQCTVYQLHPIDNYCYNYFGCF